MIDGAAASVAWVGAALVVVSDGRRGIAAGTLLATAGLGVLALAGTGPLAAGALAAGGVIAAARRLASGEPGWVILPHGSTPRLVLCIAVGLAAFWFAAGAATGPGASVRFAVAVVIALAAARVLVSTDASVLLSAAAVLALGVGLIPAVAAADPGPAVAGSLVAAVVPWLPPRTPRAA